MNDHKSRPASGSTSESATLASIRAALAQSISSPPDDGVAELFRVANESARRERVPPARLVEFIVATWAELADAAGIPETERGDKLASVLSHVIASLIGAEARTRS